MTTTVLELLAALGDTELEVAQSLRERGIKGARSQNDCCPIANYLRPATDGRPSVDTFWVAYWAEGQRHARDLPDAVVNFIGAFDLGAYPDLVSEETP